MNVFQSYLQRQYRKRGAVSPHDRLRVVEWLLERARRGVFPVSETAVGRVDPNHPGLQALLTSNETSYQKKTASRGLRMRLPDREEMAEWPTWKKLALIGGVFFGILFLTFAMVGTRRLLRSRTVRRPSPALIPTRVVLAMPTITPTLPTPTSPPLAPSPSPVLSTPTSPPAVGGAPSMVMPQAGVPADDPAAPVAIEVEGHPQPIPVYLANVDKNGRWLIPRNGAQWLPGSYIRKVFALGPDVAVGLIFRQGGQVRVRTRGGYVENYVLTRRITVPTTQLEVMYGHRPSVLIVFASSGDTREVWLAEMPEVLAYAHRSSPLSSSSSSSTISSSRIKAIVVVEGARLRAAPSLQARVLRELASGTLLELDGETGGIQRGRYTWYRVLAPYPGWIAHVVIQILVTP